MMGANYLAYVECCGSCVYSSSMLVDDMAFGEEYYTFCNLRRRYERLRCARYRQKFETLTSEVGFRGRHGN